MSLNKKLSKAFLCSLACLSYSGSFKSKSIIEFKCFLLSEGPTKPPNIFLVNPPKVAVPGLS
jgi:hypothetical protein